MKRHRTPVPTTQTPQDPESEPRKRRATDTAVSAVQLPHLPLEIWVMVVERLSRPRDLVPCLQVAQDHLLRTAAELQFTTVCCKRMMWRLKQWFGTQQMPWALSTTVRNLMNTRRFHATKETAQHQSRCFCELLGAVLRMHAVTVPPVRRPQDAGCRVWESRYPNSTGVRFDALRIMMVHAPYLTNQCKCCVSYGNRLHVMVLGKEPPMSAKGYRVSELVEQLTGWLGIPYQRAGAWSQVVLSWDDPRGYRTNRVAQELETLAISMMGQAALNVFWACGQ